MSGIGTLDGAWASTSIALPGRPNDKGLVSLVEVDGIAYACGFDDGADGSPQEPNQFVMRDAGAGFEFMSAPCTDCSRYEFTTLAASSAGGVLLGGAITDFSSADPEDWYTAFLAIYSPDLDAWTQIALPEARALDRVNDILVASDGSSYLACGVDGSAALVRQPPGGPAVVEWRAAEDAGLGSLSERSDGRLLAAGWRTEQTALRPLLLERAID